MRQSGFPPCCRSRLPSFLTAAWISAGRTLGRSRCEMAMSSVSQVIIVFEKHERTFGLILFNCSLGKIRNRSQASSKLSKMDRVSYGPWLTNSFSNRSKNSSESLSSAERASSPTTAFIDAASLPVAYLAYYGDGSVPLVVRSSGVDFIRGLTSWLDTSP